MGGLGSYLHILATSLQEAVCHDRVLVMTRGALWRSVDGKCLFDDDSYYRPISHCAGVVLDGNMSGLNIMTHKPVSRACSGAKGKTRFNNFMRKYMGLNETTIGIISHKAEDHFWRAQMIRFLLTPNPNRKLVKYIGGW